VSLQTPVCDFGHGAPEFSLPGVDGRVWSLGECRGEKGLLVMFICNHCPYVKSIMDKIIRDAKDLQDLGIGVVAINANDADEYPEDSFENMQKLDLPFPYLHDESQAIARAYDAACTPDFFGFNKGLGLQYRGRLDSSGRNAGLDDLDRDLYQAMKLVAETGLGPREQTPSMGCSIKWKNA
jgi:peroxiredoxin